MRYNLNPIAGITRAGRDRAAMVRDTIGAAQASGELGRDYDQRLFERNLNRQGTVGAAHHAKVLAGMKSDARTLEHMDNAISSRQADIENLQQSRWTDDGPSKKEVRKGTRAGNKDVKALTKARAQVEQDINAKNDAEYGN